MKDLLRLLFLLLAVTVVRVAGEELTESFTGWSDSAFAGVSEYLGRDGVRWETGQATADGLRPRDEGGTSIRFDDEGAPYLVAKGLDGEGFDGGIGRVSFWYRHWDGDGRKIRFVLEYNVDGTGWQTAAGASVTTETEFQRLSHNLNLPNDNIQLRLRTLSNPERLIIDDFTIAPYAADEGKPLIGFQRARSRHQEEEGRVRIPLQVSRPGKARVAVSIVGGTADEDDFRLETASLDVAPDSAAPAVELSLTNDGEQEADETIIIRLEQAEGAWLETVTHTVIISANDSPAVAPSDDLLVIASANITSGNHQEYLEHGERIFRALDADVIGVQEFNIPGGESEREWVSRVFGSEFHYMIEAGEESIPCGIVSRYPILQAGEWDDPQVPNRDFAWATIDIPGDVDLHVISVHFHASGGSPSRAIEAGVVVRKVKATFPSDDYVVLCGDFNSTSREAAEIAKLKEVFFDQNQPVDQNGNGNTNANRNKPYDWVMPNAALLALHSTYSIGGRDFPNGLVFDSRVWQVPPEPVRREDSAAVNMQHMAVVKAYTLPGE
ncbi:MAG: endonuclease/exonuclease/phosphatase family protein [Verrucomicrobiota bacterium JB023]|nr:endonuclease/exonuclease/phosphatase family protein [Verrucomicrobiota bacterium JB023]